MGFPWINRPALGRQLVLAAAIAVASAVAMVWLIWPFYSFSWPVLLFIALAGAFIAAVIHETRTVRYLVPLAVGAVTLGVLTGVLTAASYGFSAMLTLAVVVAAVAYLGGLVGVVCKGFYALSARWTERVLLFVGPAVLTATSAAVIVPKYGGTLYSHLHGWPYPWLTYVVGDLDGTLVEKWHWRSGPWFASPVRDYLFYFLIFAAVCCGLRLATRQSGDRWRSGHVTVVTLYALLFGGIVAQASFNPLWQASLWRDIAGAQRCVEDTDCVIAGSHGAFSCAVVTNRAEATRVRRLLNRYPGAYPRLECHPMPVPWCSKGRCEVR